MLPTICRQACKKAGSGGGIPQPIDRPTDTVAVILCLRSRRALALSPPLPTFDKYGTEAVATSVRCPSDDVVDLALENHFPFSFPPYAKSEPATDTKRSSVQYQFQFWRGMISFDPYPQCIVADQQSVWTERPYLKWIKITKVILWSKVDLSNQCDHRDYVV